MTDNYQELPDDDTLGTGILGPYDFHINCRCTLALNIDYDQLPDHDTLLDFAATIEQKRAYGIQDLLHTCRDHPLPDADTFRPDYRPMRLTYGNYSFDALAKIEPPQPGDTWGPTQTLWASEGVGRHE